MYRPAAFDMSDVADIHAFIDAAGPAHLVTMNAGGPVASVVPLLLDRGTGDSGVLLGHLARPNPQWRDLVAGVEAIAIFPGADAYVSPSSYATKAETGKVVPTWNYEVVHAYGQLVVHDDVEWLRSLVTRLTERHEGRRPEPWAVTDAPAAYIDSMLKGIVGIELQLTRIEGKSKLSQNKSAADIDGVAAALATGSAAERVVAAAMRAAAPRHGS
ncbi:MAG TPA: FMN-binding negative transcriptional regulator [Ilumatobacteraceae bacterium]